MPCPPATRACGPERSPSSAYPHLELDQLAAGGYSSGADTAAERNHLAVGQPAAIWSQRGARPHVQQDHSRRTPDLRGTVVSHANRPAWALPDEEREPARPTG